VEFRRGFTYPNLEKNKKKKEEIEKRGKSIIKPSLKTRKEGQFSHDVE